MNSSSNNSHNSIARQVHQELDFDLDGDGLTNREEYSMGLKPYTPDTDGDRVSDGREVARGTRPGVENSKKTDRRREQLQERYKEYACEILGWSSQLLSYEMLIADIGDNAWVGKALDTAVFALAIESGQSEEEAAYLLSQSPHLQFLLDSERIGEQEMVNYVLERMSNPKNSSTISLSTEQTEQDEPILEKNNQ
ncbi:MAG: hypothetical protein HC820_07540 [Hydrococcus sp. RM1_1_31]|nr:hypothetical protein [Hydrococcus sp. RM1_1_31]